MPQSLAKVYIHAIFSTKNREPLLADGWRDGVAKAFERQNAALVPAGAATS